MSNCLMIVFRGIIAVMAIAQFFVFRWQWHAMRGQLEQMKSSSDQMNQLIEQAKQNANAAKDAATAARNNTDALIASERAWIVVSADWQSGPHVFDGTDSSGVSTSIYVSIACRNFGKLTAQIFEKGYVLKIIGEIPQMPDYGNLQIFQHASEFIGPDLGGERYPLDGITCPGRRTSDTSMIFYGRVKYRDVFGEHESRFGYIIRRDSHLDRIPADSHLLYNQTT